MLEKLHQIRVKYTLAFLMVPIALIILGAADYRLIDALKSRLMEFSDTFNEATNTVLNADRDIYQARSAELAYLLIPASSPEAADLEASYRENAQQVRDRMLAFQQLMRDYPDIVQDTQDFAQRYDVWAAASAETLRLHQSGDSKAAQSQAENASLVALNDMREILDVAESATLERVHTVEDEVLGWADVQGIVMLIFSLLVLVGAVALAFAGPVLMSKALRKITARVREISEGDGDLTARIASERKDEIGDLANRVDDFIARIDGVLQEVRSSTESVNVAANEIANGSTNLSAKTEQAASNLQQTSASMEQISATVKNTADSSQQAIVLTQETLEDAEAGQQTMQAVIATMNDIRQSSVQISDIVSLIDSIAFQTNILALNASVEAARAGEHGRGFAVVAQEVRTLASRSSTASTQIRELIDTSVSHTQSGAELVDEAGEAMRKIMASARRVNDVIAEISAGTKEQSVGISQVNTAVSDLDSMTQHNASMVEQSRAAASEMRDQVALLNDLLGSFKLTGAADEGAAPGPRRPSTAKGAPARVTPQPPRSPAKAEEEWASF
ncbi:HAMP domain-containing protein [Salinicola endophyticus]|uniref:HAMP domain-containing protein n=1 Tax=Salinicola endophyticus TaxID=1949083 RepID=A0ABY8FJM9_9GAMM|nr:methyl-accepting chemotaxis protein [Salinicola endophyticus]WFF43019.1 HAMP domain-containing protein [Salinicola endophyticus]